MPIPPTWALQSSAQIASLWSGYGAIFRQTYADTDIDLDAGGRSTKGKGQNQKTTILKRVLAPLAGGVYDEGHVRKVLSYEVERWFYRHLGTAGLESEGEGEGDVDARVGIRLARVYGWTASSIEMEDLALEYPVEVGVCDYDQAKVVVRGLASFHARFWGLEGPSVAPPSPDSLEATSDREGVWEEGGYWYLRTRGEEFEGLTGEWKDIAIDVDKRIRDIPPRWRTVIHGDVKAANILFSRDGERCAVYDLQYVGYGPGVRDLVYILVSSVRGVGRWEWDFLRAYYEELMKELGRMGKSGDGYEFEVMMEHYELCLVDYLRFMKGWGLWGDTKYAEARAKEILKKWKTG